MGVINIQDIKPGMRLAADLHAPNGRFLLPKGVELTEKNLRVLTIWGVPEANVEGVDREAAMGEAISQLSPETLEECEQYATEIFSRANLGQEAVRELYQLALLRCAEKSVSGWRPEPYRFDAEQLAQIKLLSPEHLVDRRQAPTAAELVRRHMTLVSLPDIYYRIVEVLEDPSSSATTIADVISKDVSLSAKLLKLVNSPFYGFPSRIDTIDRAVALLGFNELGVLAHGVTAVRTFSDMPIDAMTMENFWKHSVACGLLARSMAGRVPGMKEERFFVAGLLHDIGRLVMFKEIPEIMGQTLLFAAAHGVETWRAERKLLGYDHTLVGKLLLETWRLPVDLLAMVGDHHHPERSLSAMEASFIYLADAMAIAMQMGASGSIFTPPIKASVWDALGLPQGLLATAVRQTDRQLEEILETFFAPEAA